MTLRISTSKERVLPRIAPRHSTTTFRQGISMEDFTLVQLDYFCVVADAGSMTAAAAKLSVAQSTLSSAITSLERRFGAELLRRIPRRGVEPTPAGLRLLSSARRLLDDAAGLSSVIQGEASEIAGRIRIAVYSPLAPIYAPRIVASLEAQHPGLEVTIVEGDNHQLWSILLQGHAEFALCYDVALGEGWDIEFLRDVPPHVIVPENHPLARAPQRRIRLHELIDEPAVLLDMPTALHHYLGYFRALGLEPRIRHTAQNYETVRAYVAAGLGYSVLNHRYEARSPGASSVVPLALADRLAPARLCIVRPSGPVDSRRSTACRSLVRTIVAGADAVVG
ncbi:LysR family transcriptional regulator [Streptomyces sp. NPDC001292]|uniref:LysR family transcriptional regulator n=1 Tax=Streptomyces sp. NPDC001292 TaxID=3364558 RepID=UPI0036AF8FB4